MKAYLEVYSLGQVSCLEVNRKGRKAYRVAQASNRAAFHSQCSYYNRRMFDDN